VLILRLKRCERALVGGRLDEAMKLLLPADARAHRRGQELLDRLVVALVERGRGHLAEGRLDAAEADWHAAASLAGNTPAVTQLRASIDLMMRDRRRETDERRRATSTVDRFVRQGQFTLAADVARAGAELDPVGARVISAEIEVGRAAVERLTTDVAGALARDDWETAVHHLTAARSISAGEPRVQQLKRQVGDRIAGEAERLMNAGRLDEAVCVLRKAVALGSGVTAIESLWRGFDQCQRAWQFVRGGQFREAREVLERLGRTWPDARWITSAEEELERACEAIKAVRGGTLGMLEMGEATVACPLAAAALSPVGIGGIAMKPAVGRAAQPAPSPRQFLLHVDGAGSFLVLQRSKIDVGPVSGSRPIDLPLITAAGSPTVTFSRCDEDYFLTAAVAVPVNDRSAAGGKLLASGDRIALGPRARIEFRRPNAASGTAVLRVSGARLPWGGVREVLLMDREIVLGTSSSAHVRVRDCAAPIIVQSAGDGRWVCKAEETIVADGRAIGCSSEVAEGARVVVGGVSFVIRRE
jgi:hypothetical protein